MYSEKSLITQIHIAKNQLMMADDAYRALLLNETGKASCKGMSLVELQKVLAAMKQRGFKPKATKPRFAQKPFVPEHSNQQLYLDKIEAMVLANGFSWAYVNGICKKSFKKDRLQFCTAAQLHKIVQMLGVFLHKRGREVK